MFWTSDIVLSSSTTPDCNGTDLCSDPANYPTRDILELVGKSRTQLSGMFDRPKPSFFLALRTVSFDDDNDDEVRESVCDVEHLEHYPRAGRNKDGVMRYIVNVVEEVVNGVAG